MDFKTTINRAKTGIRNWLVSDLRIKKLIPLKIRHRFADRVIGAFATKADIPTPYEPGKYPKGINLYGFFKAENGLGQAVRLYARALEEGQIPHTLLNTDFLDWLPQEDTAFDDRLTKENKYAVNLIHVNPDQWQEACGIFPRNQFNGRYNIAEILWELEQMPEEWKFIFDYADEIWTPSAFVARAVQKETDKPVTVIPYGLEAPADDGLTRADFGLADEDFLVLMMYDSNSYIHRKNPGGAIDAFREAFGEKPEKVKLVVKISNPKPEDIAFFEERLDRDSYVLLTERLDRKGINGLIRLCDVFLSLHRSEGFGLVIAEAMNLGTAVVATNWSAPTEFMDGESACPVNCRMIPVGENYQYRQEGALWAEPDIHQAAGYLRRLKAEPEYRRRIAGAAQKKIRAELSVARCAEKIKIRLDEIL